MVGSDGGDHGVVLIAPTVCHHEKEKESEHTEGLFHPVSFPRHPYGGCRCATIHPYQFPKLDEKSAGYIDSLSCLPTCILCVCLFDSISDIMTQRIHPLTTHESVVRQTTSCSRQSVSRGMIRESMTYRVPSQPTDSYMLPIH